MLQVVQDDPFWLEGVGAEGIVQTTFKNLATEIEDRLKPGLAATVDHIGWLINPGTLTINIPHTAPTGGTFSANMTTSSSPAPILVFSAGYNVNYQVYSLEIGFDKLLQFKAYMDDINPRCAMAL